MKQFWKVMVKYMSPYMKYLTGSVFFNILSAILNVFSFSLLIPIMQIVFQTGDAKTYEFIPWDQANGFNDVVNNIYWYMSGMVEQNGASHVLLVMCGVFCVIVLVKTACYFAAAGIIIPIRTGIVKDMRMEIYRKILSLPIGFFSESRKGDIQARISGDVNEVETSITSTMDMLIKNPILIIIYIGVLFIMSWELTLFTIVFAPIMIFVMSAIGRKLRAKSRDAQKYWSDTMSQVEETLGGLRIIKAFLAEDKMTERFDKTTGTMRSKLIKVATRQASAHPVSEFLGSMMIAIVLWFGGSLILSDTPVIDAPTFISYIAILYSVIQPIKDLSKAAYGIPKGMASMDRINTILDAESNIKELPSPARVTEFKEGIQFNNVDFEYENGRKVLNGINMTIPKGKAIAIVGSSGAGKSTLVDLIPRFYDVTGGSITLDGVDIRNIAIKDLRGLIGNVNQDPILFNDTIFNNIAFGVENADMESVIEAAKIANAHEFIMEKEEGYNTMVGDRGAKLSGGQRQRISIARAILKNPPILILDEATAALDTESERAVQEAIEKLMSNRTTIAIAHRLSTIKNSDEIIVMDEGRIVERGRHDELIALGGYYKRLNDMQQL